MEVNPATSKHSSGDRKEHHEKKRIKLDRSEIKLNVSKPSSVSNGVKSEVKNSDGTNNLKSASGTINKEVVSLEKPLSLKRPAASESDDDTPLNARSKPKASHSNKDIKLKISKSPLKESPSRNDIKKIKKPKHESNLNGSPKLEKPKKPEISDGVKKVKTESGLTSPNKADRTDGIKKLQLESGSPKVDVVKKVKSESSPKKVKSEPGLTSPNKSSSSVKSDGTKKPVKHELEISLKIKSESSLKSPEKKSKEGLLSPKTDGIKKKSSSSPKVEGNKTKEGSSVKTEKDKHKTTSSTKAEGPSKESSRVASPKTDGIKKEKHKSGSAKPEGIRVKISKDGLSSPKVEGIKKVKQKVASPKVDGVKKIKTDYGDSTSSSPKSSSESPKKSSGLSGPSKVKVEGIKKIKTESGSSASPNVSSGKETTKTSTDETDDDDDVPLAARAKPKTKSTPDSKNKTPSSSSKDRKRKGSDDDDDDYKPMKKLKKKSDVGGKDASKEVKKEKAKPKKGKDGKKTTEKGKEGKAKEKKVEEVWKWWEEEKLPEGIKWLKLEHKGPYFPPVYEPLPDSVNFYYNGEKVKLSLKSEEVAGFYAKMLDHDYTSKKIFNDNFFADWRKEMTDKERTLISHLSKCNFKEIHAYYTQKNEERKNMSKEEKLKIKEKNEAILEEYGYCMMDGHRERVGNFKIEPPGLFRGRGDHPKQGKLKKRLQARDVIINIGKDATVPDPPDGQRWKSVQHDNKVTWLACWIENIQGSYKYVMLNPTSRIKGEKDWQKYETARKLKTKIGKIREDYTNDWRAKEMRIRQRGVALYFIDKLALRAGHEKDEDTADTVGCCSLRYEHIKLHKQLDGKDYVVEFDFLGKDSIQYHNVVEVEKRVFKNLELFKQGKSEGDDLFDRLSTQSLNKYLSELMEGLSAKVFRTYNASMTLQDQLNKLEVEDNDAANVLGYNRANRAVAILCNHQRSAPKTFEQSMTNLQLKIDAKGKAIKDAKNELKDLKHEAKGSDSVTLERKIEKKKTAIERLKEQLFKLEVSQTDKNENKEIALGTSKLNYLDPRISIAWCLKNHVPIEKIYNKTQRQKFAWAIDMTEKDFEF